MTDEIGLAVNAAERRRCNAMLANDVAALDGLLDARLRFSHANGAIDDKPTYLAKIAAGRIDYLSIDWSEDHVIALGDATALLSGRMLTRVRVDGTEKTLDNRVLSVWAHDGAAWRTVAFQSTPLKT